MPDKDPAPVPVQQDEPEAARCSCCDSELPWMDDGTKWGPCQKCALKDPAAPVPVQQDEPEHCQSRSPVTGARCNWDHPYERTLHKHRSDDGEAWREPVPVQQEPEDRITRPGGWHGMMMLTDAAYRSGYEYRKAEFAPVPSVGLRDRLLGIMGTQVKPDPPSLTVMKDAQRRPYSDGFRDGQIMAVNRLRPALSEALSVLHEAGDGEVLRVVRDDDGYTIMLPGDGAWASSSDPRMLESYLALRLSEVAAEAGLPALAPDMPWAGPSAEAGTQDDDENESHAQFLEALAFGWDNDQPEARRLYRIAEVLRLPAPAEAGTQEDEADADVMAQISTMIPVREVVSEWRAWSPQSAPRTKYRDRADAEADAQELLRNEYRDVVVQRRRVGPWLPVTPAPAVSGSPDTQRQHREMFDTFAPTEPTIDDVPRSEIADEAQTQSLLAGWLTDAQHYDGALGNDALGECVARRIAEQGWRLQRTVSGTPDTKEDA